MRNILVWVVLSSLICLPAVAYDPTRQQVVESILIDAPVNKVWEWVGDFSGLHRWHPAVQSTEMKGENVRVLTLAPGKNITEKLVKRDEKRMKLKYKITDMSVTESFEFAGRTVERPVLPVNTYSGIISVITNGQGSKVKWKGNFYRPYLLNPPTPEGMSDEDAISTMSSVYKAGLENLKELLEKDTGDFSVAPVAEVAPVAAVAPVAPVGSNVPVAAVAAVAPVAPVAPTGGKTSFDSAKPYDGHVLCEIGKACKIDKFILKGFRTFSQCQVCHGIDGNGSTIAPSLLEKLKTEVSYDNFIDRVTNGFQGQMGVMPPWKTNPNVMKNIDNLYAYLKARADGILPAGRLERFRH